MRKLILAAIVLVPFLSAGCQRSHDVIDHLEPGSQIAVTKQDGQVVTGRLADRRADAIVVQPAVGAPTTVARKDIATVTIAPVNANATGASAPAAPGAPGVASPAAPDAKPLAAPGGAPPGTAPGAGVVASGQPAAAPALRWREVEVPAGTELEIRLDDAVSSATSRPEDAVRATLVERVVVGGVTAIPAGSTVSGSVTSARRPGKVKGVAELAIRFDTVKPEAADTAYRVRTGIVTRRGASEKKKDALKIGAPAAGGAILGGILGGKKGALIGTTVGGGAGTAVVLSTRGKDVRLPKGSRMVIKLMDPVTVRVPA